MSDSLKPALYIALGIVTLLLWNAWQKHQAVLPPNSTSQPVLMDKGVPTVHAEQATTPNGAHHALTSQAPSDPFITIDTDVMHVRLNLRGGNFEQVVLKHYPLSLEQPNDFIHLLDNSQSRYYLAQSGLASRDGPDVQSGPAIYHTTAHHYALGSKNTLIVTMHWHNNKGLTVNKRLIFTRGSYQVRVEHELINQSTQPWQGKFYAQIVRDGVVEEKQHGFFSFPTYTGAAISSAEKRFEKISFDTMKQSNLDRQIAGGWLAMIQHYFLSAWVPPANETFHYSSYASAGADDASRQYRIRLIGPSLQVEAGQRTTTKAIFYAGPEITSTLQTIAPGLELTVDYGFFWPISQALFWLLKKTHHVLGNWGLAIIAVTMLIKLAFYQLSASSYRSMANMRRIQPKLTALKEKYGDDRQQMSQAMIELYKKEKINPLGGCLPILIQIPVFIALYWVLIESVELRQAPFYFWIQDLSVHDPYFVLPVLMGISMLVQQKLSPAPPDPMQANVMMAMPVIFIALFLYFPSGLLLYWVVNNTLSILQQWLIMRSA